MLTGPFPLERLEAIAWWHSQIVETTRNLQLPQLASRDHLDPGEPFDAASACQGRCLTVPERHDHDR
jgi:hypothetical protein